MANFNKHPVTSAICAGIIGWQTVRFGIDFLHYMGTGVKAHNAAEQMGPYVDSYQQQVYAAEMQADVSDASTALIVDGAAVAVLYFASKEDKSEETQV